MSQSSSRAAVFHQANQPLTIEQLPLVALSAGEALVRVDCCTICGSDVHSILGHRDVPRPTILGHEIVGRIHELSAEDAPTDVSGVPLSTGDRVVWSVAASCGECDRCATGLPQKCRELFKYGHEATTKTNRAGSDHALSGGLSQFCHLARGTAIVRVGAVPDEVIAPASCATATVCEAIESCGSLAGKSVLIFGAGMLGLTASAISHSMGTSRVTICDIDRARLDLAKQFGAAETVVWNADSSQVRANLDSINDEPAGFDAVFDFSGSPDAIEIAPELARIGGHVVLVGSVSTIRKVQWDPEQIVRRLLTIHGIHNYRPQALLSAVEFLRANQTAYPFAPLVEASFPLDQINEAIQLAIDAKPCRIAIRPWD
jgi:alcohol dehydrogenase